MQTHMDQVCNGAYYVISFFYRESWKIKIQNIRLLSKANEKWLDSMSRNKSPDLSCLNSLQRDFLADRTGIGLSLAAWLTGYFSPQGYASSINKMEWSINSFQRILLTWANVNRQYMSPMVIYLTLSNWLADNLLLSGSF